MRKGLEERARTKGELPTPGEVAKRGERRRPYRRVARWDVWRARALE